MNTDTWVKQFFTVYKTRAIFNLSLDQGLTSSQNDNEER